jgi:hypothetical protein
MRAAARYCSAFSSEIATFPMNRDRRSMAVPMLAICPSARMVASVPDTAP